MVPIATDADEALRRSEDRYRDLAENLPQLIWSTDAAGKLIFANRRWCDYTGLDVAGARETDWSGLVHPEDHRRIMSTWAESFAAARSWEAEMRIRRASDGDYRWYLVRAWPQRDERGLVAGWHGSNTDIHELKSAQLEADLARLRLREQEEQLRRRSEDLLRSNSELEQFAYVAAHDLQEPTRMIASYLQLAERRAGERLDEKTRGYFGYAVGAALRMREMICSILEYSRIGKEGVTASTISGAAVFRLALEALAERIASVGARVECGPLPQVHGIAPQLVRLFQNLLSNALKFRGDEPPVVRVSAARNGGEWVFAVADNGIGINPAEAERLFGLFQRLHGTDQYPGTGIGLASCKKIVEAHQGRIWFEPAAGGGTVFKFTLPAAPEP
jgi:PAS domain S-box-containing protein